MVHRQAYRWTRVRSPVAWSPTQASQYELTRRDLEAGSYDAHYTLQHGSWFPQVERLAVLDNLDLRPTDVLVDLGCGTGRITMALASLCKHVIAIDRSSRSLEILNARIRDRSLTNVTIVKADATLPLPERVRATRVVSVQLLQHIPTMAGRRGTMENIGRILLPGGRCVIVNEVHGLARRIRGKPRQIDTPNQLYFHPFTIPEILELMRIAGLTPSRPRGCGTLYWTRYAVAPQLLVRVDLMISRVPGAAWVAKFAALAGWKAQEIGAGSTLPQVYDDEVPTGSLSNSDSRP